MNSGSGDQAVHAGYLIPLRQDQRHARMDFMLPARHPASISWSLKGATVVDWQNAIGNGSKHLQHAFSILGVRWLFQDLAVDVDHCVRTNDQICPAAGPVRYLQGFAGRCPLGIQCRAALLAKVLLESGR